MGGFRRFLLASISLSFLLWVSAIPFVQYYSGLQTLSEIQREKAFVAGIQVTGAAGMLLVLFGMLLLSLLWGRIILSQKEGH